jgi:hypothetical protein
MVFMHVYHFASFDAIHEHVKSVAVVWYVGGKDVAPRAGDPGSKPARHLMIHKLIMRV